MGDLFLSWCFFCYFLDIPQTRIKIDSILVSPKHVANALAMHRVHCKECGHQPGPRHREQQHSMDPKGQLEGAKAVEQAVGDMETTAVEAMPEIVPSKSQDLILWPAYFRAGRKFRGMPSGKKYVILWRLWISLFAPWALNMTPTETVAG